MTSLTNEEKRKVEDLSEKSTKGIPLLAPELNELVELFDRDPVGYEIAQKKGRERAIDDAKNNNHFRSGMGM